ncbi:MAG: prolyl aminopeptidase [Gammaproteobacteria bacterium]|nr:prolyl aminopeptidase [Gammaproteobacteria bacterium]MDT8371165.1 prolyl aminopeptidase [Gammaproteobacteria bacterium]
MIPLYPEIEPFASQLIKMESLGNNRHHEVYVEQCGNPEGIPVIFLHGGPGSGCRPIHRRYFDPKKYHIVLFDQRGCGRSIPHGEIAHNDTHYLVSDMEVIRQKLTIDRWVIFGGSWGATLGLIYAQTHPDKVMAMILRGVFLGRQQDIDWVYAEGGASNLFPDTWHNLIKRLPLPEQRKPLQHYYKMLLQDDELQQMSAAKTLQAWESTIVTLRDYEYKPDNTDDPSPLAHSRIQLHFALNQCFIQDKPILENIDAIRAIPSLIVHGRYDIVCPVQQSWQLKQVWPEAELSIIPLAGHAAGEPVIIDALVTATRKIAKLLA